MDDKAATAVQSAHAVTAGVVKKTAVVTAGGLTAASALQLTLWPDVPAWTVPAGVLAGSVLGAVNFRWLAYAVERVYLRQGTSGALSGAAAVIITMLKLSAIFVAIFVLITWKLVNIYGLVAGLTCCFLAILWQGMMVMTGMPAAGTDIEKRGDRE